MKTIEVDDELYAYIASNTKEIGESACKILNRMFGLKSADIVKSDKHEFSEFLQSSKLRFGSVTEKFLALLAEAHRQKPEEFQIVLEIHGRERAYFARSMNEITDSGKSTHPKQIPDSGFWVMTNSPTHQKRKMIRDVLRLLGFSKTVIIETSSAIK